MNRSMITAANTMGQLQRKLDTIGHNLSNVNTTGYKFRDARFSDLLAQQTNNQPIEEAEEGRRTPNGIRVGNGAKVAETAIRLTLGSMLLSDRELDLALQNPNQFFQIRTVDQNQNEVIRYTRDGAFYLSPDENGQSALVTKDGNFVVGQNGNILIPDDAESITVKGNGEISVTYPDQTSEVVGQLAVVQVTRPQLLTNVGDNLFGVTDLEGLGIGLADVLGNAEASVKQFALESSNVDVGMQMTEMMVTQRSYQFNAKSISIADQMMGLVNGLR